MSLGIGHFAAGATGAICLLVVTGLHDETSRDGTIAILSGLWAMLPDVGLVVPGLGPTDHTPLADLFWFHRFLDTHPFADSTAGSAVLVGGMVVAVGWLLVADRDES